MINLIEEFLRSVVFVVSWLVSIGVFIGWIMMIFGAGERRSSRLGIFLWSVAAAGWFVGRRSGWEPILLTAVLALFIGFPYTLYNYLMRNRDPEDVL